jgi:hypothetical protein
VRSKSISGTNPRRPVAAESSDCGEYVARNTASEWTRFACYDVSGTAVEVLAIVAKSEDESWLEQFADPE